MITKKIEPEKSALFECGAAELKPGAVPVAIDIFGDEARTENLVAGPDLRDRAAPALHQPAAGGDDERLAERMDVPGRACAPLERDADAEDAGRGGRLKHRVDPDGAGERFGRPFRRRL